MPAFKKVLIITYYWPPAGGPGVQRWLKFAKYLPDSHVEPLILTVDEEKASYPIRDTSLSLEVPPNIKVFRTPTRELYSLYLRITGRTQVPFSGFVQESKPNLREKVIRFIRTNLFIPDPRKAWNKYAYRKACAIIQQENIHNVITTGPPHSTHLIGHRLKKKFPSIFWIVDFRDPWTRIFFFDELGHSILSRNIHKYQEKKVIQNSDKVIVIGYNMKQYFINDYPQIPENKILIVPNGFDQADFDIEFPVADKDFVITYTGTLASNYPVDSVINSIKTLNKERHISVKLRIIGAINKDIRSSIMTELGDELAEFIPAISHKEVIRYLFRSALCLLIIPDAPGNECIVTGKLFEYLASGKPIIGLGPKQGDAARILSETESGKMFDYTEYKNITDFILQMYDNFRDDISLYNKDLITSYKRSSLTKLLASNLLS